MPTSLALNRQRIIILEGHDRAGKTTICNALKRATGYQLFKNNSQLNRFASKAFHDTIFIEAEYVTQMLRQCEFAGGGIIFDRSIPSEYVYSAVYGRSSDGSLIDHYDDVLATLGADIIYCYKDLNDQFKAKFADEVVDFSVLANIQEAYERYLSSTRCRYLKLNTSDENLTRQLGEICAFLFSDTRVEGSV